jgi:hypothetical protein
MAKLHVEINEGKDAATKPLNEVVEEAIGSVLKNPLWLAEVVFATEPNCSTNPIINATGATETHLAAATIG